MGFRCLGGRVGAGAGAGAGAGVGGVGDGVAAAAAVVVAGGAAGGVVECGVECGVGDYVGYVGGYDSPTAAAAPSRPCPSACLPRRRASVPQGQCVGAGGAGDAGGVAGHDAVPGGGAAGLDGGVLGVQLRLPSLLGPRVCPYHLQPRPYSG